MRNKAIRYILIVLGLAVLWISTSRSAVEYLFERRDIKNRWWGINELDHGDLASICYLDFVPKFANPPGGEQAVRSNYTGPRNTALYLFGDSYTRRLGDTLFSGVSDYIYIDRNKGGEYHLDTSKRNILIIEISERYVRTYFEYTYMIDHFKSAQKLKDALLITPTHETVQQASALSYLRVDSFFNKYINQNLQFNLFNYQFMMPMFGFKAAINYYLFNRASGDVVISKDKNFLFLRETITTTDKGSSYVQLASESIPLLVENINKLYEHYKAEGFEEVYLSMIPNSATINQPEGYNNLIPMIQNDTALKAKLIDIYTPFKQSKEVMYLRGDSHWNNEGRQLWLNLVNAKLKQGN